MLPWVTMSVVAADSCCSARCFTAAALTSVIHWTSCTKAPTTHASSHLINCIRHHKAQRHSQISTSKDFLWTDDSRRYRSA